MSPEINKPPMETDQPNAELQAADREAASLGFIRAELWEEIMAKTDPALRAKFIEADDAASDACQRAFQLRKRLETPA